MHANLKIKTRLSLILTTFLAFQTAPAQESSLFSVSADDVKTNLEQYFRQVDSAIAGGDIRLAKQKLSFIEFKIQKHKSIIEKEDKKAYTARLGAQNTSIKRIVDSLVQVNLTVIRSAGRSAGIEFRQQLIARGLTDSQLMPVDDAIINTPVTDEKPPEPQNTPKREPVAAPSPVPAPMHVPEPPKLQPQPVKSPERPLPPPPTAREAPAATKSDIWHVEETDYSAGETSKPPIMSWPQEPPEPKTATGEQAPAVPSSALDIGSEKGKVYAETNARKVRALIDEGKIDEAMTVFQIYQHSMERYLQGYVFAKLKSDVEAASLRDQERRAQAARLVRGIDDLVDQQRCTEALDKLTANRDLLAQCLEKDDFNRLEEKVGRASVAFGKAQAAAQAREREIRTLLTDNVNEAVAAFGRSTDELRQYLPKDIFEGLRKDVVAAEGRILDKKKQSQLYRRDILDLIGKGKGAAAFALFSENRFFLKAYLDDTAFSSLAASATNANGDYYARQAKAQAQLTRIDSLIAARQFERARELFLSDKEGLRTGLADDRRFFDLKDRVSAAYDEFSKKKKKSLRSIKRIHALIRRGEGREAYLTFLQDSGLLKEFLDANSYARLMADVQNASRDFEAGVIAARKIALGIESLLRQNRFEEAAAGFKAIRDTFDHYLDNDPAVEALAKRTDSCFTAYRKHKKWAADMKDDIQWLIDEKKGNQAKDLLDKQRQQLALYLESSALAGLESAVKNAYARYLADKGLAAKNLLRINGLLDRKRFEEAYQVFKELRTSLEQFLPEATFTNLRNEVTNAFEEFQEKKNRAHDYAEELKDLAWNKKFKEARNGFRQNQKSLKQFLDAQTYADLEKTVMGGVKRTSAKTKAGKGR